MRLTESAKRAFKKWFEWYYETHVRTPERFSMLFNHKTHEIFEDMVTDEIIRKAMAEQERRNNEAR